MRLAAVLGMGAWLAAGSPAAALDLAGTWYVLVHYKDSAAGNPDAERWEDRIWVFQRESQKLRWTEYPIVVFQDESRRFEALGTNRQSRILGYWEPSPGQLEQIRTGLEINQRGSESKTLRGSDVEGWRSAAPMGAMSANVLTYTETWSIEDPDGIPAFAIEESLGGARAESLEGRTEYRTTAVEGELLRGTYNRDGTRTGSFRMMRAGAVAEVKGSGKSESQRFSEMFFGQLGGDPLAAALSGAQADPAARDALRGEVRKALEESMTARGMDPARYRPEIDDMTDQIVREIEKGKRPDEVLRMVQDGKIAPRSLRPQR